MKINGIDKLLQVYNNPNVKKFEQSKVEKGKDELQFSKKALEYQFAVKELKQLPDIRMDKVEKIKEQVRTGTYKVDGRKIVEKMFQDANFDKRV